MITAKLIIQSIDYDISDLILDYKIDESLHSGLKHNISVCNITLSKDITLWQALLTTDSEVEFELKEDGITVFKGFLSPTYQATILSHYGLESIPLKAEDNTLVCLGNTIDTNIFLSGYYVCDTTNTDNSILHTLLSLSNKPVTSVLTDILITIPTYSIKRDTTILIDAIDNLLFEFGYVCYFDSQGTLRLYDWGTANITGVTELNPATNLNLQIEVSKTREEYKKAIVKYKEIEQANNVLVFSDTTGAKDNYSCYIPVADYYPNGSGEKEVLSDFNSNENISSVDSIDNVKYESEYGLIKLDIIENYGNFFKFRLENTATNSTTDNLTQLKMYGKAWLIKSENEVSADINSQLEDKGNYTYDAMYIYNKTLADSLLLKLCNYYGLADFRYTLYSDLKLELGEIVKIVDTTYTNFTTYARVVNRAKLYNNTTYGYVLEGVKEYSATITSTETATAITYSGSEINNSIHDISTTLKILPDGIYGTSYDVDEFAPIGADRASLTSNGFKIEEYQYSDTLSLSDNYSTAFKESYINYETMPLMWANLGSNLYLTSCKPNEPHYIHRYRLSAENKQDWDYSYEIPYTIPEGKDVYTTTFIKSFNDFLVVYFERKTYLSISSFSYENKIMIFEETEDGLSLLDTIDLSPFIKSYYELGCSNQIQNFAFSYFVRDLYNFLIIGNNGIDNIYVNINYTAGVSTVTTTTSTMDSSVYKTAAVFKLNSTQAFATQKVITFSGGTVVEETGTTIPNFTYVYATNIVDNKLLVFSSTQIRIYDWDDSTKTMAETIITQSISDTLGVPFQLTDEPNNIYLLNRWWKSGDANDMYPYIQIVKVECDLATNTYTTTPYNYDMSTLFPEIDYNYDVLNPIYTYTPPILNAGKYIYLPLTNATHYSFIHTWGYIPVWNITSTYSADGVATKAIGTITDNDLIQLNDNEVIINGSIEAEDMTAPTINATTSITAPTVNADTIIITDGLTADKVNTTNDTTTDASYYPVIVDGVGSKEPKITSTGLTINPLTKDVTIGGKLAVTSTISAAEPVNDTDVATKSYVDNQAGGITVTAFTPPDGLVNGNFEFWHLFQAQKTYSSLTSTWYKLAQVQVRQSGTYRVLYDAYYSGSVYVYTNIYVNGVARGTQRTLASTYTTYQQDIAVNAGDYIQLYARGSGTYRTIVVRDFKIYGNYDAITGSSAEYI